MTDRPEADLESGLGSRPRGFAAWAPERGRTGMAVLVIGVPKEIKDKEGRVSVQPDGVAELGYHGREVVVQAGAGSGSGFSDDEYVAAGARVVGTADEVFAAADLIVKVKEAHT